MAIPKWDDEYSIHNDIIDKQHKKLFEIAERAGTLISKQVDSKEIKKILTELFEYMKVHFRDEEQYMDSIGYPGLARQKELHKAIIADMTDLIQNIKYDFKQKLAIITEQWLIEHILKEDMLIEKYRAEHEKEISTHAQSGNEKVVSHIYTCGCNREFRVLDTIHKKIQNGQVFHCKKCGQPIRFMHA